MEDREVAGLRCSEVLERLSDYLDGELAPGERDKVEAHLRGCDGCSRFGGQMGAIVGSVRARLGGAMELDPDIARRLEERLGSK